MKNSETKDNRPQRGLRVALLLMIAVWADSGEVAALDHGRWPRATYYTVVARAGDTVTRIADRYHVPSSLVAEYNSAKPNARMSAGRIIIIPAIARATREAVLSEAIDRSAPNYATRPQTVQVPPSAVPAGPSAMRSTSPDPRTKEIQAVGISQSNTLQFAWPIAGLVISGFGPGAHGTRNEGINIAAERGAPFRAAAGGTVSYAGPLRGYGNLILITHGQNYITAYAHAEDIAVVRGEAVGKGQVIGTAGTSGGVEQPQLHFEIRRGATPINPNLLLAANS